MLDTVTAAEKSIHSDNDNDSENEGNDNSPDVDIEEVYEWSLRESSY